MAGHARTRLSEWQVPGEVTFVRQHQSQREIARLIVISDLRSIIPAIGSKDILSNVSTSCLRRKFVVFTKRDLHHRLGVFLGFSADPSSQQDSLTRPLSSPLSPFFIVSGRVPLSNEPALTRGTHAAVVYPPARRWRKKQQLTIST